MNIHIREYSSSDKKMVIELLRLNTPKYFAPEEENDFIQYLDNAKSPISLVGYDVKSKMRKSFYSANAITFNTILTDGATGNITISLNFNVTANITPGRYVYDIKANTANTANTINISIPEPFTLVNLGNTSIKPWITPYHPIRINGVWNHPINIKSTELITTNNGYY